MKALFIFLGLLTSCYGENKCMYGPSYWCQDVKTAKECGVSLFCKAMKTQKVEKIQFHHRGKTIKQTPNAPPVNVTLYYESLCPDCTRTWQYQLFPTYTKLSSSGILNIILVPFGNAREKEYGNSWKFYCQHGEAECMGNLIETCALHLYPDPKQNIPFIHCMEYYGPTAINGNYCGPLSKMVYSKIDSCVKSDLGNLLEHQMALKTEALNPHHTSVPWFTMNGVHTDAIQNGLNTNMLVTVCNAYTGTKPAACGQMNTACYKGQ